MRPEGLAGLRRRYVVGMLEGFRFYGLRYTGHTRATVRKTRAAAAAKGVTDEPSGTWRVRAAHNKKARVSDLGLNF